MYPVTYTSRINLESVISVYQDRNKSRINLEYRDQCVSRYIYKKDKPRIQGSVCIQIKVG